MPPQNPTTEPKPDAGGYYRQVSDADPMAQQSSTPADNFDFMLKEQKKPKKIFGLPAGMGKPGKILIGVIGALVIIFILMAVFGGSKSNSTQALDLMAQTQEIIRVTTLESRNLSDVNVLNLASTTNTTMISQQVDYSAYLVKVKAKYKPVALATHFNKNTDLQMQTASQNNALDTAYVSYLKSSLLAYQNSIKTTFDVTNSKSLKASLQSAYASVGVLLKSPQFNQS